MDVSSPQDVTETKSSEAAETTQRQIPDPVTDAPSAVPLPSQQRGVYILQKINFKCSFYLLCNFFFRICYSNLKETLFR